MRIAQVKVYEFKELAPVTREKVLKDFADIGTDHDWWIDTYVDAEMVGLKIVEFNLETRGIRMNVLETVRDTIDKILKNHGEKCATYQTAKKYKHKYTPKLEAEFISQISKDYLDLLREDYECRQTEEYIIETIEANEWMFTEDGKHFTLKEAK